MIDVEEKEKEELLTMIASSSYKNYGLKNIVIILVIINALSLTLQILSLLLE